MNESIRKPNWETLLARYMDSCIDKRMTWGEFDCCLFVANAIKAMTGCDYAQNFRGKYKTERGAYKALHKYGRGDIKSTLNSLLGPSKSAFIARRGDVVLVEVEQNVHAAAIVFNGVWSVNHIGLHRYQTNQIVCAWSID